LVGEHSVFWSPFCEPTDITLAEIALEAFFPADVRTAEATAPAWRLRSTGIAVNAVIAWLRLAAVDVDSD
jgi:hypothetical protein